MNYNIIESFTCSSNTSTSSSSSNTQTGDIEGDVCFDPSTVLSTKNNSKFQYISCVTEEEHPSIDDVKVNVVVRNRDGTFFNVVGESIVTHESSGKNESHKESILINENPMKPLQNQILKQNEQSVVDFHKDFKLTLELKPLGTNIPTSSDSSNEDETTTTQDIVDEEYEILSVQSNGFPSLCIMQPTSKLIFKLDESNNHNIEYELPNDQYSNISIQRQGGNINVNIKNDELGEESYSQVISLNEGEGKNDSIDSSDKNYYLCGPSKQPALVEVKNLVVSGSVIELNETNTTNEEEQPTNHVIRMDLGECKYYLSDLDHILIEQSNGHKIENSIISDNKDWESVSPKGFVAGGIRNILYKDCDNNIIQNFNVSANIVRELSVYKNQDGTLDLPSIYLIYNEDHYENQEDVIKYTRDFYNDQVIQVVGSFSYGETKNQIYSYDQMLRNSDYNSNNNRKNIPQCADPSISVHGCCPDGLTPSDDLYGRIVQLCHVNIHHTDVVKTELLFRMMPWVRIVQHFNQ